MKTDLIKRLGRHDVQDFLSKHYLFFSDEYSRVIPIEKFQTLFYFKYSTSAQDTFYFEVRKDAKNRFLLYCISIDSFMFVFPLIERKD